MIYQGNTEKFGNYLIDFYSLLEILLPAKWGLCVQQISEMNKKSIMKICKHFWSSYSCTCENFAFQNVWFLSKNVRLWCFFLPKNFVLSIYSWHNITCNYTVSTGNIKKDWKIQTLWQLCESTPARCRGSQSLKWDIWERETRYMNMKYNWNIENWDIFSANSERKTRRWGTWHVIRQYNSHML